VRKSQIIREHMGLIVLRWLKLKFTSISKGKITAKDQIEPSLHQRTRSVRTKYIITKKRHSALPLQIIKETLFFKIRNNFKKNQG